MIQLEKESYIERGNKFRDEQLLDHDEYNRGNIGMCDKVTRLLP